MSVADQFRDAEKRVAQRLKELEPAVAEYRELEVVAQRLGVEVPATASTATPRRRRRARQPSAAKGNGTTRASRSTSRSAPGKRDEQLLALIRERPGITVAEAGKALSVDPTGLYRVVSRLEQRGEVRKNGRALEPASAASSK